MLDGYSPLGKSLYAFAAVLAVIIIGCFIFIQPKPKTQLPVVTQTAAAPAPKSDPPKVYIYEPPFKNVIYEKSIVDGVVWTVKWNGTDPNISVDDKKEHYQPDSTEVETYEPGTDEKAEFTYFCGNVIDRFTPGKRIKMVLEKSILGDYNGCYLLPGTTELTFGGKNLPESALPQVYQSKVPGNH